jgi:hypothetical protein
MRDYRGFLRRLSVLYTLYGMLPTTWQLSIIAVLGAMGTSLGLYHGDLFRAFVGMMIAFGLGSMGLFFTQTLVRNATVFTKLGLGGMGIANVTADIKANVVKEFGGITVTISIQNTGVRDIFFKFLRSDLSILNMVNQDAKAQEDIHLVPVGFPQLFNLATIQHIKVPPVRAGGPTPVVGKMKLELAYGPKRGSWSYVLLYEADLAFTWSISPPGRGGHQNAQVQISNSITKNSHEVYYAR